MAVVRKTATLRPMPLVSHAEPLDRFTRERVQADVAATMRRKAASEPRLTGLLRLLAPHSAEVRRIAASALEHFSTLGGFERAIFRGLTLEAPASHPVEATRVALAALRAPEPPLCAFVASAQSADMRLAEPLQRISSSGTALYAFAAETARACRGEAGGERLLALAARLKESARFELVEQLLYPLQFLPRLPFALAPALGVLRSLERDLGRWLMLARVSMLASDGRPLVEARERSTSGVVSARAGWGWVAWALGAERALPTKVGMDLLLRLSDRPKVERDPSFLFWAGERGIETVAAPLRDVARGTGLPRQVRAHHVLARGFADKAAARTLFAQASRGTEELKGLALAAAWDVTTEASEREHLRDLAGKHATSRNLATVGWAALVRLACDHGLAGPLVTERRIRWLHEGDVR